MSTLTTQQRNLLASFADGPKIWDAAPLFKTVCELHDAGYVKFVIDGPKAEITDAGRAALADAPDEYGKYAIKVDGEEIDHADTKAEAKRNRDTVIYGEIGTEANTTIEPRSREGHSAKCPACGGRADAVVAGNTLTATCENCGWSGTKSR
jgi:predicted RNA-binding Zn-ribbon protein involved in translation (DUF1610 family)